ncbi:MAG TPA: hypothetical protein VEX86_00810 [Longimicrobium sp.]|nr:hypothetical protein [Longimicrobium sp.]
MHYDDSTRRLNLLGGLVLGAALGAGLALLLLPEDRLKSGGRVVVRAARRLGRTIDDDEGSEPLRSRGRAGYDEDGDALEARGYDDDGVSDDDGAAEDDGGDGDELGARRRATGGASSARPRAARLAKRKFEL